MIRQLALLLLLLARTSWATGTLVVTSAVAAPTITAVPVVDMTGASVQGLAINGFRFVGKSCADCEIYIDHGALHEAILLTDARVVRATYRGIYLTLPAGTVSKAEGGTVTVCTPSGCASHALDEFYLFSTVPFTTQLGEGLPIAMNIDASGNIFEQSEFKYDWFRRIDTSNNAIVITEGHPSGPGLFASTLHGRNVRTNATALAERIVIVPPFGSFSQGLVCGSEGGDLLYTGRQPNHSRVWCFDPDAGSMRCWTLWDTLLADGNPANNELFGIDWDASRGRLYALHQPQGLFNGPAYRSSWDPSGTLPTIAGLDPNDCAFDPLLYDLTPTNCTGATTPNCIENIKLSGHINSGHIVTLGSGVTLVTSFYDLSHVQVLPYPPFALPPIPGSINFTLVNATGQVFDWSSGAGLQNFVFGWGPWYGALRPDGSIVFATQFENAVVKIDNPTAPHQDCQWLNAQGDNPCLQRIYPPDLVFNGPTESPWHSTVGTSVGTDEMHSVSVDSTGKTWATVANLGLLAQQQLDFTAPIYVTPDFHTSVRLPPLGIFYSPGIQVWNAAGGIDPRLDSHHDDFVFLLSLVAPDGTRTPSAGRLHAE